MNFKEVELIKKAGFQGFKSMKELFIDSSDIPKMRGVYLILCPIKKVEFLQVGTGGHFKGRNPNISISELQENWVEDTVVVYIGKAGKEGSKATLYSRLRQYFGFGQGKNIGHWGGRLIWQLQNSTELVVCWKALPNDDPRAEEAKLIQKFLAEYSKRPFANLAN